MAKRPRKIEGVAEKIRALVRDGKLTFSDHANARMVERQIFQPEVLEVLYKGRREAKKDELTGDHRTYALRNFIHSTERHIRVAVPVDPTQGVVVVTVVELRMG